MCIWILPNVSNLTPVGLTDLNYRLCCFVHGFVNVSSESFKMLYQSCVSVADKLIFKLLDICFLTFQR